MKPSARCTLEPSADIAGERASLLRIDGAPTGRAIPGARLEAQYDIGRRILLFVTHDIPYEEQLEIVLLDESGEIADGATLVRANSTGSFRAGRVIDERRVSFLFFGDEAWVVEVFGSPRFRWPLSDPPGVTRRLWFSMAFRLSRP